MNINNKKVLLLIFLLLIVYYYYVKSSNSTNKGAKILTNLNVTGDGTRRQESSGGVSDDVLTTENKDRGRGSAETNNTGTSGKGSAETNNTRTSGKDREGKRYFTIKN